MKHIYALCTIAMLQQITAIPSEAATYNVDKAPTYTYDKRKYIGSIDNKPYNTDAAHPTISWSMSPYNQIVSICTSIGCGTGTFVSPAHILTNKHVAKCCGVAGTSMAEDDCEVRTHDNQRLLAKTVISGGGTAATVKNHCKYTKADLFNGNDWAIIELVSPDAVSTHGRNYIDWYKPLNWRKDGWGTSVDFRAGFGGIRVLSDHDVTNIKYAYMLALEKAAAEGSTDIDPNNSDGVDLGQGDIDIWDINSKDDQKKRKAETFYRDFLNKYQEMTHMDFFDDCLGDGWTLKIIEDCYITSPTWYDEKSDNYYLNTWDKHSCTSWPGDSGSALIKFAPTAQIVSLNNAGPYIVPGTDRYSYKEDSVPIDMIFTEEVQALLNVARYKKVKDPCEAFHLTQRNATAGVYIAGGSDRMPCLGPEWKPEPCSCAATKCKDGFVMVKNMGYCVRDSGATSTAANQTINTNAAASNSTSNTAVPALIAAGSTAAVVAATIAGTIAGGKNTARRAYSQQTNIAANGTTAQNIVATPQNNARAIGANCVADDMSANAERGEYAAVSIKKLDCAGQQCACVATKCKNGYKLVYKQINGKWESMGYCINPKPCTTGQHDTDVIDDVHIIRQHGGNFCK